MKVYTKCEEVVGTEPLMAKIPLNVDVPWHDDNKEDEKDIGTTGTSNKIN